MAGSVLVLSMKPPPRDDKPRPSPLPGSGSRATPPRSPVRQLVEAEFPQATPDSRWKARVFCHWRALVLRLDRLKKYPNSGFTLCVIWIGFLICPVRQILVFEVLSPLASQRFNLKISEVRETFLSTVTARTQHAFSHHFFSVSFSSSFFNSFIRCCRCFPFYDKLRNVVWHN